MAWHPVHPLLVSGGSEGAILHWDLDVDPTLTQPVSQPRATLSQAHDSNVWSLAFHPLGHLLVSASNDYTTRFWSRERPGDASSVFSGGGEKPPEIADTAGQDDDEDSMMVPGFGGGAGWWGKEEESNTSAPDDRDPGMPSFSGGNNSYAGVGGGNSGGYTAGRSRDDRGDDFIPGFGSGPNDRESNGGGGRDSRQGGYDDSYPPDDWNRNNNHNGHGGNSGGGGGDDWGRAPRQNSRWGPSRGDRGRRY